MARRARPVQIREAWSSDDGGSWTSLPGVSGFWAAAFAGPSAGWLVGVNGTILKLSYQVVRARRSRARS